MLFSCWPVRLPGPDSSLKMLLSRKNFCCDDDKNSAIWTGYGVWGSSCRCGEYEGCYLVGSFTQSLLGLSLSYHEYQWSNGGKDQL